MGFSELGNPFIIHTPMEEAEKKYKLNKLKELAGELWSNEVIEKFEWQQLMLIIKMAKTRLNK